MPNMTPNLRRILSAAVDLTIISAAVFHLLTLKGFEGGWFAVGLASVILPVAFGGGAGGAGGSVLGVGATLLLVRPEALESVSTAWAILALAGYAFGIATKFTHARREVRPKLVSLSGFAGSGKDTAAEGLVAEGWVRVAFADKLKAIAYETNPWVKTNGAHMIRLAELIDSAGWDAAKEHDDVRRILQDLGLAARVHLGPDVWLNATFAELPPGANVVITDARFPNELNAVVTLGGLTVRIERPGVGPANEHPSESLWNEHEFHAILHNKLSPEVLQAATRHVAAEAGARRRNAHQRA